MEGSKLLPKLPELPEGSEETQHLVECDVHVKPMTMLLEPHSNDCGISMGTMTHDMDGTGITWAVGLHGTMGISSPMQKRLSYFRTSTLATSKLPSAISKEDGRDLLSLMDCGKVSSLTSTLTSGRSSMTIMQSCLPTVMPSHWGMRPMAPPSRKKLVGSHGDWTITWQKYQHVIHFTYPHWVLKLEKYHEHIVNKFSLIPVAMQVISY